MCECRKNIEDRLLAEIAPTLPDKHQNVSVSLQGYALMVGGSDMKSKQFMPIEVTYQAPTIAGWMKDKKLTMNMTASYCMFCGEKYAV